MNKTNKKQGGFIWFIVAIVLAVVLAIVLKNGDKSETETGLDSGSSTTSRELATTSSTASANPNAKLVAPVHKPAVKIVPKMTASGAYIVYYTSGGFSPASLSLVRGQSSVHFVNNSSAALRIAPVDTRNRPYADFSQSKSVGYGGTFDYTFISPGAYGYYNENNKAHQAIISVN